tara:strand:- start:181777 stop:183051 length:1275 start_codon:yes stop_codon:yes gene_type:complete
MTPLQQTLGTFPPVLNERFGVTGCRFLLIAAVLQASMLSLSAVAQPLPGPDTPVLTNVTSEFLTGREFDYALAKTISLAWQGQNLRDGLRQLSETRSVSILLDRRMDPGQQLTLQIQNVSLQALINLIATEVRADISILGNTVYVGPAEVASRLRTVEEIVASQLVSNRATTISVDTSPATRRSFELLERQTLTWPDLTTPRELLDEIGRRYALNIEAADKVPHDLWGLATVPSGTSTQLLLMVLAQFNLSFEWTNSRDGIRIVDMPVDPRIERQFTLKRGTELNILAELERRLPAIERQIAGRRVSVVGTVEQIESVEELIFPERRPENPRPNQRMVGGGVTVFTFKATAPLEAFMKTLEAQAGFTFKYDPDDFMQADIRLDQQILLEAKELTAQEVFEKMFPPQNIAYQVDGQTVHLTPAKR